MNKITFSADRTKVTIGGGAIISEVIDAAYANDVQIQTGNCNSVGHLGSTLGGGYGRLMGLYGHGIDNMLSARLVTPAGSVIEVEPSNENLWWALRGAGPNFGIVTEITMKAYHVPEDKNGLWAGSLIFTEDKLEKVVEVIETLTLKPKMAVHVIFATAGPPDFAPALVVTPSFAGTAGEGRTAFASLLEVGPLLDQTKWMPYNVVNADNDAFCVKGGRKPAFGAGLRNMEPTAMRQLWNEYVSFLSITLGAERSAVLIECYDLTKAREFGVESSSYAWRSAFRYLAVVVPWYEDPSFDPKAEAFGLSTREILRSMGDGANKEAV